MNYNLAPTKLNNSSTNIGGKDKNMVLCQLQKRDWVLVVAVVASLVGVWAVAGMFLTEAVPAIVGIAGVGAIVTVLLDLHRRRSLMDEETRSQTNGLIISHARQLEDLLSIHAVIEPVLPLPRNTAGSAAPDFLRMVVEQVLSKKPELILEAGSGVSTIVTGYCLKKNGTGRVVSLEHDRGYYEYTKKMLALHGLSDWVELIYAPLVENQVGDKTLQWYDMKKIKITEPIDLFVIDGPPRTSAPMARYPALPIFYDKLNKDALVIMDDGYRKAEQSIVERWKQEYSNIDVRYEDLIKGAYIVTLKQN